MHRRIVLVSTLVLGALFAIACGQSESPGSASVPAPTAAPPPIAFLDTPAENQTIAVGTFVSGWALDPSGIAEVSVTFDDGQKPFVKTGVDFPGVKAQYANYPDADKAGFIFVISKLNPGAHSLTVTVRAKSGGTAMIQRRFQVP